MPESPEVQALADELDERLSGHEITAVDVVEFRTVKTRTEPPSALVGERVEGVSRHGKLLDLSLAETPPRRLPRTSRVGAIRRRRAG